MNDKTIKHNYNPLHRFLDNCGAFLSLACGIHCLSMPLLIVFLPLIGMEFFLNETAEKILAMATIVLAGVSLIWGYRVHGKPKVLIMFFSGAILIYTATFALSHDHHHHGHEHHAHASDHKDEAHADEHENHMAEEAGHGEEGRPQENSIGLLLLVVGALMLSGGHLVNRHYCKKCTSFQKDNVDHCCEG